MPIHATGTFEIRSWNEQDCAEIAGAPKLTRASVTEVYQATSKARAVSSI